ncbi:hypothetical protein H5410_026212 [Solanum commersonii]|uniref:Uncharacterized protein n=1 Tax=Solanum commersonii TaxID=4109 RepID=A0A9J5YY45_SOLCO|nr:hypothetical protein H5410_026212 [Solanum commersonii]
MHMWHEFDPDLLSYKNLCEEFKKEFDYFKVKQLLVAGPSGRYYIVEGDDAYFDTQCKNTMVDNNFTESFNAWILEARGMPNIKILEEIKD